MTIKEIKIAIRDLQNELADKERELDNQKDKIVGRYYKCGDAIGKITERKEDGDKNEYFCNELCFFNSGRDEELEHDTYATNRLTEIELITKEDFMERLERRFRKLRNLFLSE